MIADEGPLVEVNRPVSRAGPEQRLLYEVKYFASRLSKAGRVPSNTSTR